MKQSESFSHSVEERLNSFTHSLGAGLSMAGLVFLLVMVYVNQGSALHYVAFSVYGSFQIILYLSSALMHQFTDMPRVHSVLRRFDYISIYLLIAGTYTPFVLLGLKGTAGWVFFGIIWGLAVLGILSRLVIFKNKSLISDLLYLPMGWLIVFALKPMIHTMPRAFIVWVFIGGISYTVGIIFYLLEKLPFNHFIWHLFVLAGSMSFYLCFAFYLV